MWDSVCLPFGSGFPLKQQAIEGGPPQSTEQKHIAFGLWTVLSRLCEKPVLTVLEKKKIKGKKSPTVVSVPKKYKETNPDARIWGISSAMWLCPLTEGQKNIKGHNIWKLKVGILGTLSVYAPPWHSRLTFNKQNLFSSI